MMVLPTLLMIPSAMAFCESFPFSFSFLAMASWIQKPRCVVRLNFPLALRLPIGCFRGPREIGLAGTCAYRNIPGLFSRGPSG